MSSDEEDDIVAMPSAKKRRIGSRVEEIVVNEDTNDESDDSFETFQAERKEPGPSSSGASSSRPSRPLTVEDVKGLEISLMSWNVDGLDRDHLKTRMRACAQIIKAVNPDIVFLQEVVSHELGPIDALRSLYDIHYANPGGPYQTAILVSKFFQVVKHETVFFANSGMHRCLQILEGKIGDLQVFLLNTHLESMKEHTAQRVQQYDECMDKIRELTNSNPGCMVFFGGDLNLRDSEVTKRFPKGVADAWESAGEAKQTRYTWNMRLNDNHNKDGFNKAAMRFDRVYYYGPFNKVLFSLEGLRRIKTLDCFPSDHWAISAVFQAH